MFTKAYFKVVETVAVAACSAGLSIGEEVEITKQVNKASTEVTKKRKKQINWQMKLIKKFTILLF